MVLCHRGNQRHASDVSLLSNLSSGRGPDHEHLTRIAASLDISDRLAGGMVPGCADGHPASFARTPAAAAGISAQATAVHGQPAPPASRRSKNGRWNRSTWSSANASKNCISCKSSSSNKDSKPSNPNRRISNACSSRFKTSASSASRSSSHSNSNGNGKRARSNTIGRNGQGAQNAPWIGLLHNNGNV